MLSPFYLLSHIVKSELALTANQTTPLVVARQRLLSAISQCPACEDADRLALQGAPSGL